MGIVHDWHLINEWLIHLLIMKRTSALKHSLLHSLLFLIKSGEVVEATEALSRKNSLKIVLDHWKDTVGHQMCASEWNEQQMGAGNELV